MTEINKAAVIGAGVMGAGIAAHIANAGVPVVLLDIVPEGAENRNTVAEGAIAKLLKSNPPALMSKRNAKLITPGNIEDNLDLIADCDWIVEVVIERLDIKQDIYRGIEAHRKAGSIVSSNTSTIPLSMLVEGLPESFQQDFLITHFFNPPRFMRLLEVVAGEKTRPDVMETMHRFCDVSLGKNVVDCNDTPGFVGNRIGIYMGQAATRGVQEIGLTVEETDAVTGKPMGFPKTGLFGLGDLVGLDLAPKVAKSLHDNLPETDAFQAIYHESELINRMIADGYTGRKGKGGFYRMRKENGKKVKEALDLESGEYRPVRKASLESVRAARRGGLRALVEHPDRGGRYAWYMLSHTLAYTASLVPEIADDIVKVDSAMRDGYAWKWGPFEMIDRLGPKWFADKLRAEGRDVPALLDAVGEGTFYRTEDGVLQYYGTDGRYRDVPHPDGVLLLADVKRRGEPVARNAGASLWDIGDGVLCLEFHTKMNAMDADILAMMREATKIIPKQGYKALVIHNDAENFSVGANIGLALFAANIALWPEIENNVETGQKTYKALKYAPFPVVAAPSGMALGGGCEILLHSDAVCAHAETYSGLVEVGVGLIPGWGGCKEMVTRWNDHPRRPGGPMPAVIKVFEMLSTAKVNMSAAEAQENLFIKPGDPITMNRDRLLADAKATALRLAEDYQPPEKPEISLPGPTAKAAMGLAVDGFHKQGKALDHDVVVSTALAEILSGGDTDITEVLSEDDLNKLERQAFMSLVRKPETLARMEHMLETGKPLRN